jgi:hypothetical protein
MEMAEKRAVRELPIGTKGLAFEDIDVGKTGEAWFTIEGKLERIEVYAVENIRKFREIQIIALGNRAIEATPTELKFEKVDGTWQRVTETYPLPVSMGRKAITYVTKTCTNSGNTELVAAPGSGYKLRVHYFSYSNAHSSLADVGMRFGDTGDIKHRHALAAEGGNVNANLTDCNWEGGENEALNAYLAAAYSGGVYITVGYTRERV